MSRRLVRRLRFRTAWAVLILLVAPFTATAAMAAEDCAGTAQQLIQYLNKAETESSPATSVDM